MIAFTGQFDTLLSRFYAWFKRTPEAKTQRMIGIHHEEMEGFPQLIWRTGSLVSIRETDSMLADINTLVCFYMTPPEDTQTRQGHDRDVALTSAVNIARCAQNKSNMRVILVTRILPKSNANAADNYDYWNSILNIFKTHCINLNIIHTSPILSECDIITLSLFEHIVLRSADDTESSQIAWMNQTQPIEEKRFFHALHQKIIRSDYQPMSSQVFEGDVTLSYQDWREIMTDSLPSHSYRLLSRFYKRYMPYRVHRARFLRETLSFHTFSGKSHADEPEPVPEFWKKTCALLAEELLDGMSQSSSLLAKSKLTFFKPLETTCYVQRVLKNPKRTISEIADILMQWLPRHFQRALSVEDMGPDRVLCRISRVPVLEIEKHEESPTRCRLFVRFPWGKSVQSKTNLLITTTGTLKSPDILLIVIEDGPDNSIFTAALRSLLHAFGRYLKDYGCGD